MIQLKKMSRAVMATKFHSRSTDEKPLHHLCPKDKSTWCPYNREIALGIPPEKITWSHNNMKVKLWNLNKEQENILHQVYEKLRDPKILKGCLIKSTQNAIESLNARIWKRCPKIFNHGKKSVEYAVNKAILEYNMGYANTYRELYGEKPMSDITMKYLNAKDKKRERLIKSKKMSGQRVKNNMKLGIHENSLNLGLVPQVPLRGHVQSSRGSKQNSSGHRKSSRGRG